MCSLYLQSAPTVSAPSCRCVSQHRGVREPREVHLTSLLCVAGELFAGSSRLLVSTRCVAWLFSTDTGGLASTHVTSDSVRCATCDLPLLYRRPISRVARFLEESTANIAKYISSAFFSKSANLAIWLRFRSRFATQLSPLVAPKLSLTFSQLATPARQRKVQEQAKTTPQRQRK